MLGTVNHLFSRSIGSVPVRLIASNCAKVPADYVTESSCKSCSTSTTCPPAQRKIRLNASFSILLNLQTLLSQTIIEEWPIPIARLKPELPLHVRNFKQVTNRMLLLLYESLKSRRPVSGQGGKDVKSRPPDPQPTKSLLKKRRLQYVGILNASIRVGRLLTY